MKLDNIVLKYEILSILLILLFHQQFVIMAAATVVIAPVQTHAEKKLTELVDSSLIEDNGAALWITK